MSNQLFQKCGRGLLFIALVLMSAASALAQTGTISGTVKSKAGESLSGANVAITGTTMGASTDANGNYTIANVPAGTYRIRVSFIGYEEVSQSARVAAGQAVTVDFSINETGVLGDPVVVSASRRVEKLTEAPASIAVVTSSDLAKSSGLTYGEGMQKARGVDVYRTGVDGVGINARGFMTAYSYRMQLMADGKNGMLPGAGLAAGNLLPVARDDIERLETVLGPSSALYGPNAHNGLVNIVTKDPRDSRGTTLTLGGGTQDTRLARLRHAGTAGERFAYKVNGEFTKATDFIKNDPVGSRADGTVVYEDPDPNLESLRFDGAAYLNLARDTDLVYSYGYSNTNSIGTTNVGRNQIVDWVYQYHQLRLNSKHFFAQGYLTQNNAGRTYAIDNVAALVLAGVPKEQAIDRIKFIDDSKRYNLEVQGNVDWQGFHLIGGINHEDSRPVSKGSYLVDTTGFEIKIKQTGFYGQVERDLGERFKVVLAGRYDRHDNYDSQFSPRAGLVYKLAGKGAFRFTYNKAFQAPAILQQYLFLPFGSAAGVPIILRGNGRGLTLANGQQIAPLDVETNETFEVGYKGLITNNLTVDVNAYSSKYNNFISPLTTVGSPFPPISSTVVKMGDGAITRPEITLTYLNFGEVAIKGVDIGLGYQLNRNLGLWVNYSYIDPEDIRDNLENDLNGNEVVDINEYEALSFNTPNKKYNVGIALSNIFTKGTYASFSMRHVDKYDFISGRHRATAAKRVQPALPSQFVDRGPLGGFETFDLNLSYAMQSGVTINVSATNIFNAPLREMAGSPEIRRIVIGEVKYNFNLLP